MKNYLRTMREQKGMTLDYVSKALNVTKAQISKLERGIIRLNDFWLDRLSAFYGCSIHDLIDDDDVSSGESNTPSAFISPLLIGAVDMSQGGELMHYSSDKHYHLRCARPQHIKQETDYFAVDIINGHYGRAHEGDQLVFAKLHEGMGELQQDSHVIIALKDGNNHLCESFFRSVEYSHGYPYAVFKIRRGRHQYVVQSQHCLFLPEQILRFKDDENSSITPLTETNELKISAILTKIIANIL